MRGDPAFDAIRKGPEFIPLLDVADAGDERAREAFDHAGDRSCCGRHLRIVAVDGGRMTRDREGALCQPREGANASHRRRGCFRDASGVPVMTAGVAMTTMLVRAAEREEIDRSHGSGATAGKMRTRSASRRN